MFAKNTIFVALCALLVVLVALFGAEQGQAAAGIPGVDEVMGMASNLPIVGDVMGR